jgi:hypothetical protein
MLIFEKVEKSGSLADFTGYFSLSMIFLFPSFLIIMSFFYVDLDLVFIHLDICAN